MTQGDKKVGLADAYALQSPEDSVRLYRDWAATYDSVFAAEHRYIYHQGLAQLYLAQSRAVEGVILDVGCGTGLVAEALEGAAVDGLDISPEMLSAAADKGLYRKLIEADLTQPLTLPDKAYAGIVSAGAFTHGHVGTEALSELIRVAAPGAVFALGINSAFYETAGFAAAFDALSAAGDIDGYRVEKIRCYAEGAGHEHADDLMTVALFTRRA